MRKVLVDKDGLVLNAIEIEEDANWTPPKSCRLLTKQDSDKMDIGDKLVGKTIIKPSFTDRLGNQITPLPIVLN